jgi:hypothetical protein
MASYQTQRKRLKRLTQNLICQPRNMKILGVVETIVEITTIIMTVVAMMVGVAVIVVDMEVAAVAIADMEVETGDVDRIKEYGIVLKLFHLSLF